MSDGYRKLACRLVQFMDDHNYILEDDDNKEAVVPQGLLRDFRKAVYADSPEDPN